MNRIAIVLLGAVASVPAQATDLGEPLATEDWELLDATLVVSSILTSTDCGKNPPFNSPELPCWASGGPEDIRPNNWSQNQGSGEPWVSRGSVVDAEGNTYIWNWVQGTDQFGNPLLCGSNKVGVVTGWDEIHRCTTNWACALIARMPMRCVGSFVDRARMADMWTDATNGYLYVKYESRPEDNSRSLVVQGYDSIWHIDRFEGLTPLLDVFQSYNPTAQGYTFRSPVIPEGFPSADWFDAYYGELPVDFTEAQGLDCGFPASPPSVGDYLTVADTLPTPEPGRGFWYVTAVNYLGQKRYGRQRVGGKLSSRNPALLPDCTEEGSFAVGLLSARSPGAAIIRTGDGPTPLGGVHVPNAMTYTCATRETGDTGDRKSDRR